MAPCGPFISLARSFQLAVSNIINVTLVAVYTNLNPGPTPKCGHTHAGGFAGHDEAPKRDGVSTVNDTARHDAITV
eukprot:46250-Prymnesium_polylepis.1